MTFRAPFSRIFSPPCGPGLAVTSGPSILLTDSFTDTDSSSLSDHTPDYSYVGGGWTVRNGAWIISSNRAAPSGVLPPTPNYIATVDAGLANISLSVIWNAGNAVNAGGVVVRYNPGDGTFYVVAVFPTTTNAVRLFYWDGSALTQLKSKTVTIQKSTDYVLSVTCNGTSIEYTVNGVTDTYTMDKNLTNTHIGLRAVSSLQRFDDLSVLPFEVASVGNSIEVLTPQPYEIYQRDGSNQADLVISGIYRGSPSAIEASYSGGGYVTIDASPTGGTFSGTLQNQSAGQGSLVVRFANDTSISTTVVYIGIGDVFACAGQSNMSGRGTNAQVWSHATLKAGLFGNDYRWHRLVDSYDTSAGQVDTVSSDVSALMGSFIPLLATSVMAQTGLPVAFIPCAMGGTAVSEWQPGADHNNRATLYGSMNYRITQAGGARCVLWWQGERDAVLGTAEATYNTSLDTLANAIMSDQGIKLMPCKLQDLSAYTPGYDESAVNAAITTAWGDNANVLTGPDFSDLTPDGDGVHFNDNAELVTVAGRWWTAIQAALGW